MVNLAWDPDADVEMTKLESDGPSPLLDAVNDALDALEADPGDAAVRKLRYQNGMWGIRVRTRDDDWLILWEPMPETDEEVIVQYLGPEI